ncbi:MAG: hypothetical protein GY870_02660 [archaeon]|nr:hypothetical protein [archaeon]
MKTSKKPPAQLHGIIIPDITESDINKEWDHHNPPEHLSLMPLTQKKRIKDSLLTKIPNACCLIGWARTDYGFSGRVGVTRIIVPTIIAQNWDHLMEEEEKFLKKEEKEKMKYLSIDIDYYNNTTCYIKTDSRRVKEEIEKYEEEENTNLNYRGFDVYDPESRNTLLRHPKEKTHVFTFQFSREFWEFLEKIMENIPRIKRITNSEETEEDFYKIIEFDPLEEWYS